MSKEIVYLVQPAELIGTNRYKIGRSEKQGLNRCENGYKKGTRFICISECEKSKELESIIKKTFNKKFNLLCGKEYFEGNEHQIIKEFQRIIFEQSKEKDNLEYDDNKDLTKSECRNNLKDEKKYHFNNKDLTKSDTKIKYVKEKKDNKLKKVKTLNIYDIDKYINIPEYL